MDTLLDIRFKNGKQRIVDLQTYVSAEPFGANIATEIDIRWDDISEGLYLEVSTNTPKPAEKPKAGEMPSEPDERGALCELSGVAFYCILEPGDFIDVSKIIYKGECMLQSLAGQIIVMAKLNTLCSKYLSDPAPVYLAISSLYDILRKQFDLALESEDSAPSDIDKTIAIEMGLSLDALNHAREIVQTMQESFGDSDESEIEYEEDQGDELL